MSSNARVARPQARQTQPVAHPWVISAVEALRARGQTIGFAESCTGGLLSAIFARMPGVSSVFIGSVVAYSYETKSRLLGVPTSLLRVHGAVSVPVAQRMASGARDALGCDWSISVTGVAGPGGGSDEKPVGSVCFAIVGPGFERVARRRFPGGRREVQMASARFALHMRLAGLGVDKGEPLGEPSRARRPALTDKPRKKKAKGKKKR